jgi:hypothetical protein
MHFVSVKSVVQHLKLGTARIMFYDMARKKKSSTINLTRPFYLRVETYRGVDRQGQPKFKNNNEAGRLLFKWIIDHGVYNNACYNRLLNNNNPTMNDLVEQAGYGDEFAFMLKEYHQWYKTNGAIWVDQVLENYAIADSEDDDIKKSIILEDYEERTNGDHFLNGFSLSSCRLHKAHRIRGGFKYRFERTFFRPTDMNIYFLDYLEVLYGSLDSLEITAEQLTEAIAEQLRDFQCYSFNTRKARATLLSEVNRDYSTISRLSERLSDLTDEQIVQMYEFNQNIPAFVFKDRMTRSLARSLFEEELVGDPLSFIHLYRDDVELATYLMSKRVRVGFDSVYRYLSTKLRRFPEIYQHVGDDALQYLPENVRSNRDFMLPKTSWWMYNIVYAAPNLLNDVDYLSEAFARAADVDIGTGVHLKTEKNLTKEFVEELRLVGASVRIKGEIMPITGNEIRELMPKNGRYENTDIRFNAEHIDAVRKIRFAKALEAQLSVKDTVAPTKRNKI